MSLTHTKRAKGFPTVKHPCTDPVELTSRAGLISVSHSHSCGSLHIPPPPEPRVDRCRGNKSKNSDKYSLLDGRRAEARVCHSNDVDDVRVCRRLKVHSTFAGKLVTKTETETTPSGHRCRLRRTICSYCARARALHSATTS